MIILQDGSLKVINFGQAVELPSDKSWVPISQPSHCRHTAFSAPEVLEGRAHIHSDVFSLGVLLGRLFAEEFSVPGKLEERLDRRSVLFLKSLADQMTVQLPDARKGILEVDRALRLEFDSAKPSARTSPTKLTEVGTHFSPSKSSKSERAIG